MSSLKVGDKAPEFKLKSHMLEDVSLSDYKGKNIVVLFFPLVNTSVCEKELCSTRDSLKQYDSLNAQVLAISVDSPFAHKLWNEKMKFNFPLLSDFNKEVCKKYGAFYDVFAPGKFDFAGVAKRSAFVVDKNGVIKYAEVLESAGDEPNYNAIQDVLKSLN
ncbi:MAG TPA: redoxin domain-containing protein [Ignavibacteriales bacterium]|nr:redoxin domain-containing protein [Ignavibacteriales bacterium]